MAEAVAQGWQMAMREKHLHSCCGKHPVCEQRKLLLPWELRLLAECDTEAFFPQCKRFWSLKDCWYLSPGQPFGLFLCWSNELFSHSQNIARFPSPVDSSHSNILVANPVIASKIHLLGFVLLGDLDGPSLHSESHKSANWLQFKCTHSSLTWHQQERSPCPSLTCDL